MFEESSYHAVVLGSIAQLFILSFLESHSVKLLLGNLFDLPFYRGFHIGLEATIIPLKMVWGKHPSNR